MPSTVSHRAGAPSPAPGVTRLGDPEVNFYLLEAPDGLVLVDGGLPRHLRNSSHTWRVPAARLATSAQSC